VSREDLRAQGLAELIADVEFCRTHQCRPAKFAEHASTASDFFYQVREFAAAEEILDGAIQVLPLACSSSSHSALFPNGPLCSSPVAGNRCISLRLRSRALRGGGLGSVYSLYL
jgi:hypothetical protein